VRILVVAPGPDFSVADVHSGLVKGLRMLVGKDNVASLNLNDRLDFYAAASVARGRKYTRAFDREGAIQLASKTVLSDLYQFWPDIVIFTSCFFITPEIWATLGRRPHHTVAWFTESPYEDDKQLQVARYVDTAILNDDVNIQKFREVNPRTWYFPHSYDPDVHRPGEPFADLECDFGWVGTAFPSRIRFFRDVNWRDLNVKLGGNWLQLHGNSRLHRYLVSPKLECMDNIDAVRLYRSCKLSANIYRKEASEPGMELGWAAGPREIELAACGTFFLRESRGEGDELFPQAPTFESPDEFGDLVRWWSQHDDLREKTARLNREAIADRTFQNTAARLLQLVDGAPKRTYL
jgi:spore maturation protein CgeB